MGWLADRIGLRITVAIGACLICRRPPLSAPARLSLYVGQGLMVWF